MEVSSNNATVNRLNGILQDAVAHSRELFSQLEDQTRTIESLRRENDKLRREIEQCKSSTPDLTTQLERLFQQNAAKQAEIESLKADLQVAKRDGARTLKEPTPPIHSLPSTEHVHRTPPGSSPVPKRRHGEEDDGALRTLTDHALNIKRARNGRKDRKRSSLDAEAILSVAEDGQEHLPEKKKKRHSDPIRSKIIHPGVHSRLDALLSTSASSSHSPLCRGNLPPVQPSTPLAKPGEATSSSNKATADKSAPMTKHSRSSNRRFLRLARDLATATNDSNPLRKRPLGQLNLSHFKLNPEFTGYGEEEQQLLVRGGKGGGKCRSGCKRPECCGGRAMRAIAMSLAPNNQIGDDDLLLDFLGPASEQKVATLTPVARENLLHEIRVKRAANEFGLFGRNSSAREERAASPIGFWTTEIPDSEERQRMYEQARQWERAEVERRYHAATTAAQKGQAKWVFADEL